MQILRNTILVLGLLFVAVLIQGLTWHWWFETFVINRIHTIYAGVHIDVLVEQIPTMLSFLLLGAAGFFVFESSWPPLWATLLGVAGSLFRAAMTQSAFTGVAEVGDKINYFATYAYPPLFALAGAMLAWLCIRKRGTPLTRPRVAQLSIPGAIRKRRVRQR